MCRPAPSHVRTRFESSVDRDTTGLVWDTINRTPYAVDNSWGRNKDGVHEWLVAVRATFDIHPDGKVTLAEEQPPPRLAAEFNGEDGLSSLKYEADIVAPKPTTDVLINGTAYAPRGRPCQTFDIAMRVDTLQKNLRVFGDRLWWPSVAGMQPTPPKPVTEVPIVYERAYGGFDDKDPDPRHQRMDARNPVGRGVAANRKNLEGQLAHNFEYLSGRFDKVGPAGFGPLASYWSPRLELQGTYDVDWFKSRKPLLPLDWKPESLLCAPADQRSKRPLRGGEVVELLNLTQSGFLRFELPKIYLTYTTHFTTASGRRREEHRGQLSSVIIEPDAPRVVLVWTSSLLVHSNIDYLDETVVREKAYLS